MQPLFDLLVHPLMRDAMVANDNPDGFRARAPETRFINIHAMACCVL